jgi:hypothetical protein
LRFKHSSLHHLLLYNKLHLSLLRQFLLEQQASAIRSSLLVAEVAGILVANELVILVDEQAILVVGIVEGLDCIEVVSFIIMSRMGFLLVLLSQVYSVGMEYPQIMATIVFPLLKFNQPFTHPPLQMDYLFMAPLHFSNTLRYFQLCIGNTYFSLPILDLMA